MAFDIIPGQDGYKDSLKQALNSSDTTIYVNNVPDCTIDASNPTYMTIDPKNSRREVVKVVAKDATAGTLTIETRNISQGVGVTTEAQAHPANAEIKITNNYQNFKNIKDEMALKPSTSDNNTWTGTNTFTNDVSFTGATTDITMPNKTTAERTAGGSNGDFVYDTDEGIMYQYVGGAWTAVDQGTPLGSATETTEGKVELATLAEHDAATTGARVVQAKNTLKAPATYTPAFLTGGTAATAVIGTWNAVTDGSVRITIDGVQRDVSGLDFSGDADLDAVAATIQTGIRALTSSTETVVWSTDHFIVSSVDTSATSAITVTSSTGAGTDISGAGGTDFMDCDTGNGVVTDKVLDQTQDEDKIPVLDSTGKIASSLVGGLDGLTATTTEINQVCDGVGVTVTTTNLDTLTDVSDASALHYHSPYEAIKNSSAPAFYAYNGLMQETSGGSGSTTLFPGSFRVVTSNINSQYSLRAPIDRGSSAVANNPKAYIEVKVVQTTNCFYTIGFTVGAFNNGSTSTANHAAFVLDSGTLYASVANGTTQSKSAAITGYDLTADYVSLEIVSNGTNFLFYVNGSLEHTSSGNEPSTSTEYYVAADTNGSTGSSRIDARGFVMQSDKI